MGATIDDDEDLDETAEKTFLTEKGTREDNLAERRRDLKDVPEDTDEATVGWESCVGSGTIWIEGKGTTGVTSFNGGGRRFSFLTVSSCALGGLGTMFVVKVMRGGFDLREATEELDIDDGKDTWCGVADGGQNGMPNDTLDGGAEGGGSDGLNRAVGVGSGRAN